MGGWGIPHICSWLTQETPDDLVSYINIMSTFYEVARDPLIKNKVSNILSMTLNQNLAEVGILEIMKSPRNVYVQGIIIPTGSVLAKLKEGMLSKCESPIFKQALQVDTTPAVKEELVEAVKSLVVDANVLELLGHCLPEVCVCNS
jgi:hypothetical protein